MSFLVDTNVLLRMIQRRDPTYADARRAATVLTRQGNQLSIIPQNLIEFWAVATRPAANNGLALSVTETAAHIRTFKQTLTLLTDSADIFPAWERLVELHAVSGRQAHDARLVAAMLVHDVSHIPTFNTDDCKRFSEITVVNPENVT
jgi:predicted nucleic acid-binding protein